jgi:ribosomal protein L7/L12
MSESLYAQAINAVYYCNKERLAAIAVEVAKTNPSIFLRGHEATRRLDEIQDLEERMADLIANGEPIKAIKLHREMTGSTLADSKAVVDRLRARLASQG